MQSNDSSPRVGYRSLGLITNPFVPGESYRAGSLGVKLSGQAASMRLLHAIDAAVDDPDRKPIMVEKSPTIPQFYNVAALAGTFACVGADEPVPGIMQVYVPIDAMRMGRVRAPLGFIAERVANTDIDLTLSAWSRRALVEPDTSLAEWVVLGGVDVGALVAEIDADPRAFSARIFGEVVGQREGAEDTEMLMRVGTARQRLLETDPTEPTEAEAAIAPDVNDEATDDPLADSFVVPLAEDGMELALDGESTTEEELVFDYIVAYTRVHLSPVVARGIRAFRAQGIVSMTEEFKVTKAPTKTLAALLEFVEAQKRIGVLIYDGFSSWHNVPTDLRMKILATLQQLRWALKDTAVIVLLTEPGQSPELDETFATARRVSWDFTELPAVESDESPFDPEIARLWVRSSSLDGDVPAWLDALIGGIPADAECGAAFTALGEAIDAAAEAGAEPSPAAASDLLAASQESPTR